MRFHQTVFSPGENRRRSQRYKFVYVFPSHIFWKTVSHVLTNTSLFKRGKFLYSPQAHNYVIMVDMLRAYYGIQHKETFDSLRFSRDFARSGNQRIMWLHGQESVNVNYNPANFGGHKHSGSGDIMFLFR